MLNRVLPRPLWLFIVALCGAMMLFSCGERASPNDLLCGEEYAGPECEVFELVNRERQAAGREPLRFDQELARAARAHAADMFERQYFDHTSPEGETFAERVEATSYPGTPRSENIAFGYTEPRDVVQNWMASPGHRDNILREGVDALGVGRRHEHWVQVFGVDDP